MSATPAPSHHSLSRNLSFFIFGMACMGMAGGLFETTFNN